MNISVVISSMVNGAVIGCVYALIALGLTLIFGIMNIINFAHGALLMIAMYCSFWLFHFFHIDPYLSILFNIPFLFLIGVLIQKLIINRVMEGPHYIQILVTIGLMLLLENASLMIFTRDVRSVTSFCQNWVLSFGYITLGFTKVVAAVLALILTALIFLILRFTTFGKAIRATSQNKTGASLVGIPIGRIYLLTFGMGTACVGAAGAMLIPYYTLDPYIGLSFAMIAFITVVMGGLGSFGGVFISGIVIGVVESLGALFMPGSMKMAAVFIIFILVLLLSPLKNIKESR
jgi:branched-chain amino acid transport system permease protein